MAGGCAPLLQVDVPPWLVPVSFWLVLLSFLMACVLPIFMRVWGFMVGRCVPLLHACVASWLAVVLPCFRRRRSLEASDRILQPGTQDRGLT